MIKQAFFAATLVALATPALAQPQAAGERDRTERLGRVHITPFIPGRATEGRLLRLGPETLTLLIDNQPREMSLGDVLKVERIERDSIRNGMLIGAAVGGGWAALVASQGFIDRSQRGPLVAYNALLGALLGAGIDALHHQRTTIYLNPNGRSSLRQDHGHR